ncbi:hypothetical protein D3C86_1865040 [compost metagenome]
MVTVSQDKLGLLIAFVTYAFWGPLPITTLASAAAAAIVLKKAYAFTPVSFPSLPIDALNFRLSINDILSLKNDSSDNLHPKEMAGNKAHLFSRINL